MKCSFDISNFLEEISHLTLSVVFLVSLEPLVINAVFK